MYPSFFAEYMCNAIRLQKKIYGNSIDSLVMLQVEMEKTLVSMYGDFNRLPMEVRDILQDIELRMNAWRSTCKMKMDARFDYCIDIWRAKDGERR